MANSIPVPAYNSLIPIAASPRPSLSTRLTAKLFRASDRLLGPVQQRTRAWFGADPSLVEELVEDVNTYTPRLMQEIDGTSRYFERVTSAELRASMLHTALRPQRHNEAGFNLPRSLYARRFPNYYLEPFHGQPGGYLAPSSAAGFDAVMEWMFDGKLGAMRMAAADALSDVGDGTIVDLGTGTGAFLRALRTAHPRARLVGVDLSPYMLKMFDLRHADGLENVELVEADLTRTALAPSSAQGVTLCFVLHELPVTVVRDALREAHRLLEPGGRLVILDGVEPSNTAERIRRRMTLRMLHEPYLRAFTRIDLVGLLSELGFGPVDTQVVAPMVAVRAATKR